MWSALTARRITRRCVSNECAFLPSSSPALAFPPFNSLIAGFVSSDRLMMKTGSHAVDVAACVSIGEGGGVNGLDTRQTSPSSAKILRPHFCRAALFIGVHKSANISFDIL